jgi:DNA processing protein
MYDSFLDYRNPMFDLNRDLIEEQKDIIIINDSNYHEVATSIIRKKRANESLNFQTSLFD